MFEYRARLLKVVDGDTVDFDIDLGLHMHAHERVRLLGINTPEKNSSNPEERTAALAASKYLEGLLNSSELVIKTERDKQEKYGRYLCKIFRAIDGPNWSVNEEMVRSGHAVVYDGTGSRTAWPWK